MKTRDLSSLASRLLLASIFLSAGFSKVREPRNTIAYMKSKKIPLTPALMGLAAATELGAGLSLLTGYRARRGAVILFGFLAVTTLTFHDFWNLEEGQDRDMQLMNFFKNLGILGGLVSLATHGGGNLSLGGVEASIVPERLVPKQLKRAA